MTFLEKLKQAVLVRAVEPLDGWWSEPPYLAGFGRQFVGDLPPVGQVQPLMECKVSGQPRPVSVQLYRSDRQVVVAANRDIYCNVEYGAGGVSNSFRLDFRSGTQFTVVAKWVRVNFEARVPVSGAAFAQNLENVVLGATAGLGPMARGPAVFTPSPSRVINTTFSQQDGIPDFATGYNLNAVGPLNAAPDYANLAIDFRAADNTTIDTVTASTVLDRLMSADGLRIPGAAQFVSVLNSTGGAVRLQNQFVLSI